MTPGSEAGVCLGLEISHWEVWQKHKAAFVTADTLTLLPMQSAASLCL